MRIGTRSVLFGAHCFFIHPLLIAYGWYKAYGFRRVFIGTRLVPDFIEDNAGRRWPLHATRDVFASLLDPRLWLAFVVHDLGYIGKPNMDGPEGETHPEFGARIMRRLCGDAWGDLVLLHSRYYAKRRASDVSPLCFADKWVIVVEPSWLYLPRVWASGELREFLDVAYRRALTVVQGDHDPLNDAERAAFRSMDAVRWHRALKSYMHRWIIAHADGTTDTWTRARHAEVPNG